MIWVEKKLSFLFFYYTVIRPKMVFFRVIDTLMRNVIRQGLSLVYALRLSILRHRVWTIKTPLLLYMVQVVLVVRVGPGGLGWTKLDH